MKLLLDTHTFIWMDSEPDKLSPRIRELCQDTENILLVSVASIWEIQIKSQLGKLKLKTPLPDIIRQQKENGIEILPIEPNHIFALEALPNHHKDPFDRLLIAQAIVEDAVLLTADPLIQQYPIKTEW
jgi:PIN domain nuclease of toxin-antitoxin system